jgi:hypothetical protein
MATWQHLRSSTANKRPTTSLADGRIAINTNTASPGLFFKDSAGTGIVKVGPVHVGTTAPNSVPASGGSTGNYTGEQWLDTSVSPAQMKVWNGSTWVGIVADELPVSKLQDGAARQLIQTDAAGTGVEWTSNVDVPGTLDVTSTATFDSIAQHPLGTAGAPTITFTGDTNTGLYSPGADQVAISTNGTGRLFVDSSGRLLVGTSTAQGNSLIQIQGNAGASNDAADLLLWRNNSPFGFISNTIGARINFGASPTSGVYGIGAQIMFQGDAVWGNNDYPGRLMFSTTADGASSPTERMRITSSGQVRLAGAGITFNGDTAAANELDDYEEGTWTPALTGPTSQTYSSAGYYVKIGNTVTIQGFLNFTVAPTGGTNYRIALPFASTTNKDNVRNGLSLGLKAAVSGAVFAAVFENTANLYFYDGSANALTLQANWSTGRVNFFGTYTTT